MVKEFSKAVLVALALAAILAACAPAQANPQQVLSNVETSVALTVAAQNDMSTASAATLTAQAPLPTATESPTTIPLSLPTAVTTLPTATPFVVIPPASGGSGGSTGSGGTPDYACTWTSSPPDLTRFKPGDDFEVKFTITNSGAKTWVAGKDFAFIGDTLFTTVSFVELPELKPNHFLSFTFGAQAPMNRGRYAEQWKVQGIPGCYPLVVIIVGK
jgi:hypothetical protein